MTEPVSCSRCGTRRKPDEHPLETLAWVSDREGGALRWLCPRCAREHVRDIEGKLPPEYW